AQQHNFLSAYARALYASSQYWLAQQQYTQAIRTARSSLNMLIQLRDTQTIAIVFNALMDYQIAKGDNKALISTYQQFNPYLAALPDHFKPLIARIEHRVASAHADMGNRDKASQHYLH